MASHVMVIDDDPDICRTVSRYLERNGYEVSIAGNGPEALQLVQVNPPDLILLDVMMPQMDGFEVLERLRQLDATMDVPVIMVTAKDGIRDKKVGFETGADDYVTKPFHFSELKLRVEANIRREQMDQDRHARRVPPASIKAPLVLGHQRSGMFRTGYLITKRIFDVVVCVVLLPVVLPLFLLISLAIYIDSPGGAVVFVQNRTGRNGKRFKMYKFRTMVPNAEELKEKYRHLNELTWPDFKITNDPRRTRVGKFLRKTSLDELPQVFNVLKGDMSLVGPRPTSFAADTYQLWHTERLEVRPGITGLWQVKGRANLDFDDRVELDIEYIERQSWALDIAILFRTVTAVFSGEGAH